jgi:hypothetical protein
MANKIAKGQLLTELVKGSMEYTMSLIKAAFSSQFPNRDMSPYFWVEEIFSDYVIVKAYSDSSLKSDEYYKVPYTKNGDVYTFVEKDKWEVVELAYQPQTSADVAEGRVSIPAGRSGKKRNRFDERIDAQVSLLETVEGKRRVKIEGAITANVVNGNRRRYPSAVVEAAIDELRGHLNESAGQGRAIQVLGEAEHPSDKSGRANLLETVTKWEEVTFDGQRVDLTGRILETSKGKDILALMEGGVKPGVSLRGYGEGKSIGKGDDKVFEVSELHITGFDLVLEPSFENSAQLVESINSQGDDEMNPEEILKLLKDHPELFKGITEAQVKAMGEEQLKNLETRIRTALGIDGNADIAESLKATAEKARKFEESQAKTAMDSAIAEATKDLPFGEKLNKVFVESFKNMEFTTVDQVKKFAESQRKQFAQLAASGVLKGMGFDEKTQRVQMLGDVLENETGTPEFGRAAFEITESVRKHEMRPVKDLRKNESRAAQFTIQLLERFDKLYQRQLMAEAQAFTEAEAASDLNLPYSVSRAVIAEAFPTLVAANVFDIGIMNGSPENIWYEAFTGETGYTVSITDEVETAGAEGTWYDLSHANLVPGTVVVTSNPAGTTYVEGTDYVIDYELGKIKALAAGAIDANDVLVDYDYNAVTEGEGAEIQQAKTTLSYQTITARAFRVADQINHEAIVFSRSQLGWDAVARTMANIIRETRRIIDRHLIEKALAASLSVANNSGGTWTNATDPFSEFAEKLGYAKVKVANRYYEPTGYLLSETNSDLLSNWDGFTRTGFPNALLDAAGFVGGIKGLPVFKSTQMRDGWGLCVNREIVMHRVFQPMTVKGPFPTYGANRKVIAAEQYYSEEYNASLAPIANKAAHIVIA